MGHTERSALRQLKRQLKPIYVRGQQFVAQTLFSYSAAELEAAIGSLGIASGDSLFVHSGFSRTSGFSGTAGDVIDCLLKVVGGDGHLLMMSIPYRGSTQRYAEKNTLFDVLRTPSAVGLISEVFRRRQGVRRSLNAFHPILASGPLAAWLTADHEKCAHSCGKGSPFERFLNLNGKFLFFDAPYSSLTFMHYVEDAFRDRLPVDLYDPAPATVRMRDASGRDIQVRQFFFSEAARARRNFTPIQQMLTRDGLMKHARVGNTRLLSVSARSIVESAGRLLQQGSGFYK